MDHLDVALAQAVQVRADADGAPGDVAQREGLVVRAARLARDEPAAGEVLHADAATSGPVPPQAIYNQHEQESHGWLTRPSNAFDPHISRYEP